MLRWLRDNVWFVVGLYLRLAICVVLPPVRWALVAIRGSRARSDEEKMLLTASEVRATDRRRPIVLLRSFNDDDAPIITTVDDEGGEYAMRLEAAVAPALGHFGPFIKVGKPGELARDGAACDYFEDAVWQPNVASWMDESTLLIMVPGFTAGLAWELQQIAALGYERKVLILMPPPDGHLPSHKKVGSGWHIDEEGVHWRATSEQNSGAKAFYWTWTIEPGKPSIDGGPEQQPTRIRRVWSSDAAAVLRKRTHQARWAQLRAAFRHVPGFQRMPAIAPEKLIAMHLCGNGDLALVVGPEVPRLDDYERAIEFAVYGMKCHQEASASGDRARQSDLCGK
jgi:hypothetical protein